MKQIRHVYCASGTHSIEVTDDEGRITRGAIVPYDQPATHPAGYLALTDYHRAAWEDSPVYRVEAVRSRAITLSTDNNFAETVPLALAGERSEQGPEDAPEGEGK